MDKNRIRNYFCCLAFANAIAPIGMPHRATAQTPSFEVASIKPIDPSYHFDGTHHWVHVTPAGASYWYMTLDSLITHAYDVRSFQVTGGPEWANTEHFDIDARFPEGADKKDEPAMLQSLLKDRFKLTFHIEKREVEGYVLEVAKSGAKLKPSPPDPVPNPPDSNAKEVPAKPKVATRKDGTTTGDMGSRGTVTIKFDPETWTQHFERSKMTMEELSGFLSTCLGEGGHNVTDETGLEGPYQVALDCPLPRPHRPRATGANTPPSAPDPDNGPALTHSLDALGLKLEKRKIMMDIYVIDHVEEPSEN